MPPERVCTIALGGESPPIEGGLDSNLSISNGTEVRSGEGQPTLALQMVPASLGVSLRGLGSWGPTHPGHPSAASAWARATRLGQMGRGKGATFSCFFVFH